MARAKKDATLEPMTTETDPFPDPPMNLAGKLAAVGREIGYVMKDKNNDAQNYRYVSAEAILKKANEALFSRGVCIQSSASLEKYEVDQIAPGKSKVRAVVRITLAFIDSAEGARQSYQCEGLGEGTDNGDKAVLKANTSALKYALANAFLISWGDDPEADPSTDRDASASSAQPRKAAASNPDVASLIASATLENMGEVRRAVMGSRGSPDYPANVEAIKAKQEALGWKP